MEQGRCCAFSFYRVLFTLIIVFLFPYSLWINIFTGLHECFITFDLNTAAKSSTLYVFAQKFWLLNTDPNCSASQVCLTTTPVFEAHEHSLLRSLIRSGRSGISGQIKYSKDDYIRSLSRCFRLFQFLGLRREAEACMLMAVKHQAIGRTKTALKLLKHAAELDPRNSDILILLGEAFERSWIFAEGKDSKSALSNPDGFIRALTREQAKYIVVAESLYTKALIIDPAHIRATQNRARMLPIVEKIDQQRLASRN